MTTGIQHSTLVNTIRNSRLHTVPISPCPPTTLASSPVSVLPQPGTGLPPMLRRWPDLASVPISSLVARTLRHIRAQLVAITRTAAKFTPTNTAVEYCHPDAYGSSMCSGIQTPLFPQKRSRAIGDAATSVLVTQTTTTTDVARRTVKHGGRQGRLTAKQHSTDMATSRNTDVYQSQNTQNL